MSLVLELRSVNAYYGPIQALESCSVQVKEGGITALLGANGAGKTTMLRAICGMIRSRGEILLAGQRIDGMSTEEIVRRGVAHVPDGRGTFVHLTVEENLRVAAYTRRDKAQVADDFRRIYGYFPRLKERSRQYAGTLSGGEQQMLAISRALMLRPRLMLLDEPSFGLAPLVVREIFGIMRQVNRDERVSILLVEQNANLALELSDFGYVLETGRVVVSGSSTELKSNPAIRRSYLGY